MNKITDLKGISKYYCSECKHFHIRKYKYIINNENIRIKTENTPFFKHKEFAHKLSSTELWKLQFKRSWNSYDIKKHKKSSKRSEK